jgi:hypothetical protein
MTNLFAWKLQGWPAARTILSIPNVCGVSYLLTKGKWSSWEQMNFYLFKLQKTLFDIPTDATTKHPVFVKFF